MTAEEIRAARREVPPKEVRILLPVWGDQFVSQFLYYFLPTLLAPGNIPGIAAEVPVRFIALCGASDLLQIRGHPTWRLLATKCTTEIKPIDDIIMSSNSASTTVTLAFEREVRAVGAAMVDTCFIFLTPDYVMANGSLVSLWRRMRDGASGIQAGNFQVSVDALKFDLIPRTKLTWARPRRQRQPTMADAVVDGTVPRPKPHDSTPSDFEDEENLNPPATTPITPAARHGRGVVSVAEIPARQLVAFALANLHPVTIGNTVNFLASHNIHTNRLFWWVDEKTLIGRFFLMHMICIRPEIADFQIGASCDYSFIPEMCPSGNVDVITDSDEYLVVEAQLYTHELKFTRFGPLQPARLARRLGEWTTAFHRANARHTLVFHAGPVPDRVEKIRAEADGFMAEVNSTLATVPPLPHRGHPFWRHAAAYNHFFSGKEFSEEDYAALLTSVTGKKTRLALFGERFARFVRGKRPMLYPWQPRWTDYRALKERLAKLNGENGKKAVLLVTNEPLPYLDWAHKLEKNLVVSFPWRFSVRAGRSKPVWPTRFNAVIVDLNEEDINYKISVNRIAAVAAPGAELLVLIRNQRRRALIGFNHVITAHLDLLQATSAHHVYASFVRMSRLRWSADWAMERLARSCERHPKSSPLVAALCILMMPILVLVNLFEISTAGLRWPRQKWSSVFLAFRAEEETDG